MVSRAYLNPQNAEVKANFRVFPGFMGVFWNLGWMELQIGSIYCTYNKQTSKRMWCLYNRFGFPAVPVTKVRQRLPKFEEEGLIAPGTGGGKGAKELETKFLQWDRHFNAHSGKVLSYRGCYSLATVKRNVT